jgi:hypothetical protein
VCLLLLPFPPTEQLEGAAESHASSLAPVITSCQEDIQTLQAEKEAAAAQLAEQQSALAAARLKLQEVGRWLCGRGSSSSSVGMGVWVSAAAAAAAAWFGHRTGAEEGRGGVQGAEKEAAAGQLAEQHFALAAARLKLQEVSCWGKPARGRGVTATAACCAVLYVSGW